MSVLSQIVANFVKEFYAASDVGPTGHQAYANLFTQDAVLIMGATQYDGHDGVLRFRETGWEKVETRKHTVFGVFVRPDTASSEELMLYGTVDYDFKDGTQKEGVEWAGRMQLMKKSNGAYRLKFYQVYIVSMPKVYRHRFSSTNTLYRRNGEAEPQSSVS